VYLQVLARNSHGDSHHIAQCFGRIASRTRRGIASHRARLTLLPYKRPRLNELASVQFMTVRNLTPRRSRQSSGGEFLTFQAFGDITKTSSKAYIACGYTPCERYRSASSDQLSASVCVYSRSSTRELMASEVRPRVLARATRRFAIGYTMH
jgi:hypothetical protein